MCCHIFCLKKLFILSCSLEKRSHFFWLPLAGKVAEPTRGRTLEMPHIFLSRLPSQDLVCRDLIAQVSRRPKIPKLGLFDGGGWLRYHFFSHLQDCAENIPIAYASGKRALSNFQMHISYISRSNSVRQNLLLHLGRRRTAQDDHL